MRKQFTIFIFLLIQFQFSSAQILDVANLQKDWQPINDNYFIHVGDTKQKYNTGKATYSKKEIVHSFEVKNSSNTQQVVAFFIGHWIDFEAGALSGKDTVAIEIEKRTINGIVSNVPFAKISVQPQEQKTIIIKPKLRGFNYRYVHPFIIKNGKENDFGFSYYFDVHKTPLIISVVFVGLMLAVLIYAIFSWLVLKSKEYLFYGFYILFFILYFVVRLYYLYSTDYKALYHSLFVIHFTLAIGYCFYAMFLMSFLGLSKHKQKGLYKLLIIFSFSTVAFTIMDAIVIYALQNFDFSIYSYTIFRLFLLFVCLLTAISIFRINNFAEKFLAWGVLMLFIFGIISLSFSLRGVGSRSFNQFFDLRMPIYQLGIILELIFFTAALLYKNAQKNKQRITEMNELRLENERKELAKSLAVLEARDKERHRIAQEIHDDIGSGLTNIRLLSEIAKTKEQKQLDQSDELRKISDSASELIENMNEIVWSLNSKNDLLHNLVAYLRRYVVTYFEKYEHITVTTSTPDIDASIDIKGDFRRAIFLIVKECLHNIIKHSNATKVNFEVSIENKQLVIKISDNGKGFALSSVNPYSNGLRNMQERIDSLMGSIKIESNKGTMVHLTVPY